MRKATMTHLLKQYQAQAMSQLGTFTLILKLQIWKTQNTLLSVTKCLSRKYVLCVTVLSSWMTLLKVLSQKVHSMSVSIGKWKWKTVLRVLKTLSALRFLSFGALLIWSFLSNRVSSSLKSLRK